MAYLSDLERQESEKHRTASRQMTNWAEPPCDIVQMILEEEWYSFLSDNRKYIKLRNNLEIHMSITLKQTPGKNIQFNWAGIYILVSKLTPRGM